MPNQLPPIGTGDTDLGEFLRVLSQSVVTSVDGPHVTRTGNSVFVGEALEQETTFMGLIYSASLMSGHGARWVYTMYQAVPVLRERTGVSRGPHRKWPGTAPPAGRFFPAIPVGAAALIRPPKQ